MAAPRFHHDESAFKSFDTKAVHSGQPPEATSGAVMVPISLSTTFAQVAPGVHNGFDYSRSGNPTRQAFEACLASLEGAKFGLSFSSGLAATTTLTQLFGPGDQVVCSDDVYGGTNRYLNRVAVPAQGLVVSMVDLTNADVVASAITATTKLVWLETPSNPMLKLIDIAAVCKAAHAVNAVVVVDNTFASPYFQQPLSLGADVVLHSATKYLNGHSDVVMGVMMTNSEELHTRLKFLQNACGAVPSPFDCYLVMRSLKTLHLRMERSANSAMAIARMLEAHPAVSLVRYPGLASHPQHALAKTQMRGFGAMISFVIKGGLSSATAFFTALRVFVLAESLGGVESLTEHPAIMTHASVPPDQRARLGIDDGLIRLSVGVEGEADLIADLQRGLDAAAAVADK